MAERQKRSGVYLARFLQLCGTAHAAKQIASNPAPKVVKNLATFLCTDKAQCPTYTKDALDGILSLQVTDEAPAGKTNGKAKAPVVESTTPLVRRGAEFALRGIADAFGKRLFQDLPSVWELSVSGLKTIPGVCDL
jgi:hypothetical protein